MMTAIDRATAPATARRQPRWLAARSLWIALAQALIVLAVLVAWQLASGKLIPKLWVSSPTAIFATLERWVVDGSLWMHLLTTILGMLSGYAIGAVIGIALGFLLGWMPRVDQVAAPFIAAIYCLPKIALLPLFVIFFGIGVQSKIALVALVVVFLLLYSTRDGARDVDPDLLDALALMGATRSEVLRKVMLPASLVWILTGLRVAVSYAFTTTVVGELLSSNQGLGFLIASSAARFDSAGVFAAVLILVICSVLLTEGLNRVEKLWRRHAN